MIARYSLPEMADLFSDHSRYATWVRVEVLAAQAQASLGRTPAEAVAAIQRAPVPSAARIREIEKERDHEVLSFLAAYCERIPDEFARWVHLGMTSYDLVDTALGVTLAQASDLLIGAVRGLRAVLADRAIEHWDTVCVGRTHGVHAEPTTLGHKLAGFAFAVDRSICRLAAARDSVAVGTISGAVGTYPLVDPRVERYVCEALGLGIEPAPSQVVARDRHAELVQSIATMGGCVERLALELRLLQRTEVSEVEEPRTAAYQGSSAMPHKRNPTISERLCGLARVLRAYVSAVLEDIALWHERDLAHSSVERIILPDSLMLAHYQVTSATDAIARLTVDAGRMRENLNHTRGLVYSSALLADLLEAGFEREHAYRLVQAAADRTVDTGVSFETALKESGIDIDLPGPERFLAHHHVVRERLESLRELED